MQHSLKKLTGLALALLMAGCGTLPETGTPPASPTPDRGCGPTETAKDSPDTAKALADILQSARNKPSAISARTHSAECPAEGGSTTAEIVQIDYDITLTTPDLAAPLQLGYRAFTVINSLERAAPGVPGDIALTFDDKSRSLTLNFTRDEGRSAVRSKLIGIELLVVLGYPTPAAEGQPCTPIYGRQPSPELSRLARAAFDKAGLNRINVAASAAGTWCGDAFTTTQTELHVIMGWQRGDRAKLRKAYGNLMAEVIDALATLPSEEMPGELPPRVIALMGWDANGYVITTLQDGVALRDRGLEGSDLYDALGFVE